MIVATKNNFQNQHKEIGDQVRVVTEKKVFDKADRAKFSSEIYEIIEEIGQRNKLESLRNFLRDINYRKLLDGSKSPFFSNIRIVFEHFVDW